MAWWFWKKSGRKNFDEPRHCQVQCASPAGLHQMAYVEWGNPANDRVVVCVHGLTRNGRDFDVLAKALAPDYRVICPDVVGRGVSDWLRNPAHYGIPQYLADMVTLIARVNVTQVDWVGTSMGGLIGMALASLDQHPIRRLVLNDVGPEITRASLVRIGQYVGQEPVFPNFPAALAYQRTVSAPFGPLTNEQWEAVTRHAVRQRADGQWVFRYDPAIASPFRNSILADINLWPMYDSIHCPTLLTRGAESDLLTDATAQKMAERGPHAERIDFAGVGHAPMFQSDDQVQAVKTFLDRP